MPTKSVIDLFPWNLNFHNFNVTSRLLFAVEIIIDISLNYPFIVTLSLQLNFVDLVNIPRKVLNSLQFHMIYLSLFKKIQLL